MKKLKWIMFLSIIVLSVLAVIYVSSVVPVTKNTKAAKKEMTQEQVLSITNGYQAKRLSDPKLTVDLALSAYLRFINDFSTNSPYKFQTYLTNEVKLLKSADRNLLIAQAKSFSDESKLLQAKAKTATKEEKSAMLYKKAKKIKDVEKELQKSLSNSGYQALLSFINKRVLPSTTLTRSK